MSTLHRIRKYGLSDFCQRVREEKPQYCTGKGCILIDDMERNIKEWNEMGGTGIVNVSADETMSRLKELGIL